MNKKLQDTNIIVTDISAFLEYKAYQLRKWSIVETSQADSGHVTSCLSCADIMAVIFFYSMRFILDNYNDPDNDRFILSKGHAAPVLYAVYKEMGMLTDHDLLGYRTISSSLEGHPTYRFSYAEAATGSLGMGLSIGAGEALCARLDSRQYITYVLMGDSEIAEGSVWEAAFIAVHYKLENLIGIIDANRLGQSTETMLDRVIAQYERIFTAIGFNTFIVDGHDIPALMRVFDAARGAAGYGSVGYGVGGSGKPVMIIARTIKGYGIEAVEDKNGFHGKPFKKEDEEAILAHLKNRFLKAALYKHKKGDWQPLSPFREKVFREKVSISGTGIHTFGKNMLSDNYVDTYESVQGSSVAYSIPLCIYAKNEMVATRKAYGNALALLGDVSPDIVSLDAEVKNSTYAELFEKKHPERFFQCFVAEQNMVGMGIGFAKRGKIPFISTFGCFFTRAHDQVRMAVLSNAALRLVGSHVGVSIGQDGPSQMALEDIGMMRALPHSVVLYPSDAVSTHKLVEQMAWYKDGISYMRTTRGETPVLYDNAEQFPIGGCKVLRQSSQDKLCVIAAGITVQEALIAADIMRARDIPVYISVIDLYSIKPFDLMTVIAVARNAGNKIITVEDHYLQGGIGEMVASALCNTDITVTLLAVKELPRSGKPEELLAWAHIDAQAIVTQIVSLLHIN